MEGHSKPRNFDNFAAVSRGILQTGSRNLAKFSAENCGPYSNKGPISHRFATIAHTSLQSYLRSMTSII